MSAPAVHNLGHNTRVELWALIRLVGTFEDEARETGEHDRLARLEQIDHGLWDAIVTAQAL